MKQQIQCTTFGILKNLRLLLCYPERGSQWQPSKWRGTWWAGSRQTDVPFWELLSSTYTHATCGLLLPFHVFFSRRVGDYCVWFRAEAVAGRGAAFHLPSTAFNLLSKILLTCRHLS